MPKRAAAAPHAVVSRRMAFVVVSTLALGLSLAVCGGGGTVEPPEDVTILVSRSTVAFNAVEGDAIPAGVTVSVSTSKASPPGSLTIEVVHPAGSERTDWLSHSISGSELVLRPATTDVHPRTYTATVHVRHQDPDVAPASIVVTYAVSGLPRQLLIHGDGDGSATIAATAAGVACSILFGQPDAGCARSLPFGTPVTLTLTGTQGSTFEGWSGDCTGTGPCALTMDHDHEVTASLAPPPTGRDLLVFGDAAIFGEDALEQPGNERLVRNILDFTGSGARAGATVVARFCGEQLDVADPRCAADWAEFDAEVLALGYTNTIASRSATNAEPIAAGIKVLVFVQFCQTYNAAQANVLRAFAGEGGRIVFVSDDDASLPLKCDGAGDFAEGLGANVSHVRGSVECGDVMLPATSLESHLLTAGMAGLEVDCASEVVAGVGATPLLHDRSGTRTLGVVAPVNTTPMTEEEQIGWDLKKNTRADIRPAASGKVAAVGGG